MDLYQATEEYVSKMPVMQSWPELQELFTRMASARPKHWELPLYACKAVGGSTAQAIPAVAAVACAQISIILIDDMLDEDPRGEYHHQGSARAANYASGLQAAAFEALHSKMKLDVRLSVFYNLNRMILTTTLGQHLDTQTLPNEKAYWRVVENKSAPFFGAAFYVGALAGGASPKVAEELEKLGRQYGKMIQVHDDLNDVMKTPANPDWTQGRSPLPILFAQLVNHPDRARFLELRRNITAPEALAEAQDILVRCGAISYCVDRLLRRYQTARKTLNTLLVERREIMDELLQEVIAPVERIFAEIGQALPESTMPTTVRNLVQ